jgi:hypothetical protein
VSEDHTIVGIIGESTRYPGSGILLRVDSRPAHRTSQDAWIDAENILEELEIGQTARIRYRDWPHNEERDSSLSLSRFAEALEIAQALVRMQPVSLELDVLADRYRAAGAQAQRAIINIDRVSPSERSEFLSTVGICSSVGEAETKALRIENMAVDVLRDAFRAGRNSVRRSPGRVVEMPCPIASIDLEMALRATDHELILLPAAPDQSDIALRTNLDELRDKNGPYIYMFALDLWEGTEVPRDRAFALDVMRIAAEKNYEPAIVFIDEVTRQLQTIPVDNDSS